MKTLTEVKKDANELSSEDQAGLAAHILSQLTGSPLGPDDDELARREAEIDNGTAEMLTHDQLCDALGR